jgi:hypothetical protein
VSSSRLVRDRRDIAIAAVVNAPGPALEAGQTFSIVNVETLPPWLTIIPEPAPTPLLLAGIDRAEPLPFPKPFPEQSVEHELQRPG